tara:strand:- start:4707 stop:4868 length:162 start_codon:yes stop_codon:yes gene_type:complete
MTTLYLLKIASNKLRMMPNLRFHNKSNHNRDRIGLKEFLEKIENPLKDKNKKI